MSRYLKKKDVWRLFWELHPNLVDDLRQDPIAVFVDWQAFTDGLCKCKEISEKQWQNWETPRMIYHAMHRE